MHDQLWQLHVFNCLHHFCAAVNTCNSSIVVMLHGLSWHGISGFDLFARKLKCELDFKSNSFFFYEWKEDL